jgi:hypothetical protein
VYRTLYPRLSPSAEGYVERTLAKMDAWGYPPVLVLSPIHPALRKALGALGWDERHRQVVEYIESLHKRYAFTFVDMTSLSSFGGSPNEFFDGMHMTLPNVHRFLDVLVRRSGRAL